jgi:hypothetical protein
MSLLRLRAVGLPLARLAGIAPLGDQGELRDDLVLVVGDLEAVDDAVAVLVQRLEVARCVGPELGPVEIALMGGVGLVEPGFQRVGVGRPQPERFARRAEEQLRRRRRLGRRGGGPPTAQPTAATARAQAIERVIPIASPRTVKPARVAAR